MAGWGIIIESNRLRKRDAMNHLNQEKSPYLLQHADNPVDWYPWGNEAFERAAKEDKPVFLSIGYSTCHWCHVMAHESFEDEAIAELLNREYIAVKVDREERPDVDAVYMAVCQALTGSGGWPLTVILTPDQKPFFAGTYYPKYAGYGQPGLMDILREVSTLWKTRREELLHMGHQLVELLNRRDELVPVIPEKALIKKAAALFEHDYDAKFGGFGKAPKFPVPHNLLFLLRYAKEEQIKKALAMAEHTLCAMAAGGIFDHIGGGFSRYSTDDIWLVPHFEKMLYDNALLTLAYLEAFRVTQEDSYRQTAIRTLSYMQRELMGPDGGFFCGQDADSEGVEGKYYFFTPGEVKRVLGQEMGERFCKAYDITESGNFEGVSIPNRMNPRASLPAQCSHSLELLYEYRRQRTALHLDDKVILSWNAWAVIALAKAERVLGGNTYLSAAEHTHAFILNHMTDEKDRLFLRWCKEEAAFGGTLDDYAVYGLALLELYRTTYQTAYLKEAILRAEQIHTYFYDREQGGYYMTASDTEKLIARSKETYDGAIPSGNAAAGLLLHRIAEYTGESKWLDAGKRQIQFLAGVMNPLPYGHSLGLLALMEVLYPAQKLVIVSADGTFPQPLKKYLRENTGRDLCILFKTPQNAAELAELIPFTKEYPLPDEGYIYYLCENGACTAPQTEFEKLNLMRER